MPPSASPARTLRIDVEQRGPAAIVTLDGSATVDVSNDLRDRLLSLMVGAVEQVVVDLSGLRFVASAGLGALVAAHLRCRQRGGMLKLVAPPSNILQILNVTHLTKLFPIYESVEAALAAE
jgi:anti-sigma B factor antagonist